MSIATFMFYFFEAVAAISAVGIIFIRNVFQGALLFIVCLLAVAGIYILAFAEFIAVVQILIYAGGILVLIIFGIMLTSKISGKPLVVTHKNLFAGFLVASFFVVLLTNLYASEIFAFDSNVANVSANTFQNIGVLLLSDFVLPFEVVGVLLLMALVGAAVMASSTSKSKQ